MGVWIETLIIRMMPRWPPVTPCVGVWIETDQMAAQFGIKGHTLRGCVDWNIERQKELRDSDVTPCVGVWIETANKNSDSLTSVSHPAWVCGLKLTPVILSLMIAARHTLRGCVDWNLFCNSYLWQCTCHTLRGCVDWNLFHISSCQSRWSHTLRGCVDWNL